MLTLTPLHARFLVNGVGNQDNYDYIYDSFEVCIDLD